MARGNPMKWLVSGWRRWILAAVAMVLILMLVWSIFGKTIAVNRALAGYEEDPKTTEEKLLAFGLPYSVELRKALLKGGRKFPEQFRFSRLMAFAPFFATDVLKEALASDDLMVKRAAAMALLNARRSAPPPPLPDDVLAVYEEWSKDLASPELDMGLAELYYWRDPRVAKMLVEMVVKRSEDEVSGIVPKGYANRNREVAARQLKYYISDPKVIEALGAVATRKVESPMVIMYIYEALAGSGYSKDIGLYWEAARSPHIPVRQSLAANLEHVKNPEVIPILEFLTNDVNEVVRRHAVDTLMDKRAPGLMDNLEYLAEDSWASIPGDLAWAVRHFRRDDKIPYVVHCLKHTDPVVVEKSLVVLFGMTRRHFGFTDEEWKKFEWDRPLMAGEGGRTRTLAVHEFMNDEARKKAAIEQWNELAPPAYTDQDRLPHLIRQLGHADQENVRRAMRELKRITGRTEGFPPECLDPNSDPTDQANAMFRYMTEQKEAVTADWEKWYAEKR